MASLEREVLKTLQYFSFFNYLPTLAEIYTFLAQKTSKKALKMTILKLEREKKIKIIRNSGRYTLGEYSIKISNIKYQISKRKLNNRRFKLYIKLLSLFPQIKLVGLSGTVAMMNAEEGDDVDLFIITARNRLFTGRFIALVLAQLFGLRRKRNLVDSVTQNKVCLNLFFDERALEVPKFKKTEYVAHEVLQMKPLINKDGVYERFLAANRWVFRVFPNSKSIISNFKFQISKFKNSKLNKNLKFKIINLGDYIEKILKKFQLSLINKHKTTEIITSSQLWFHPEDFGEKVGEAFSQVRSRER